MSPGNIIVILMSLGSASVFLALVVGMGGGDAAVMVASVASMTPAARRKARFEQLDEMTKAADDAIEARKLGRRAPHFQDQY